MVLDLNLLLRKTSEIKFILLNENCITIKSSTKIQHYPSNVKGK